MQGRPRARFLPCLNLISLWGVPEFFTGPNLDDADLYPVLRAAGYEAVQSPWPTAIREAGFAAFALARISELESVEQVARRNRALGFMSTTVIAGSGLETDGELDRFCAALIDAGIKHGHPMLLETHRGSISQDIRRTLGAVQRFPELRFTADLSHWYVGNDLRDGDFQAKLDALAPIFSRVRFMHGRIATPTCVQASVDGAGDRRPFVEDFRKMWERCFSAFLASAGTDERIPFAPELLPAVAEADGVQYRLYYAQTRRNDAGEEREESDRWTQAAYLMAIAREAFDKAQRSADPVPPGSK